MCSVTSVAARAFSHINWCVERWTCMSWCYDAVCGSYALGGTVLLAWPQFQCNLFAPWSSVSGNSAGIVPTRDSKPLVLLVLVAHWVRDDRWRRIVGCGVETMALFLLDFPSDIPGIYTGETIHSSTIHRLDPAAGIIIMHTLAIIWLSTRNVHSAWVCCEVVKYQGENVTTAKCLRYVWLVNRKHGMRVRNK